MSRSDAPEVGRKILMISPFYYPERISTGKVNTALGRELVAEGHELEVVCSHPLYPDWCPTLTDATLPGQHLHRGGAWVRYTGNAFIRRIVLELWFSFHCAATLNHVSDEASIAVMVYPPSLFGLVVHAMLPRHVRRVAIVHDLQGEYSKNGYHRGFSLLTTLIHGVEKLCLGTADRCVFLSAEMAATAQKSYRLRPERVAVQYPFVTLDPLAARTKFLSKALPDDEQHVVYSGALGEKQNPQKLADFMDAAAKALPKARFHVFSQGPIFDALRARLAQTSAVEFHDLVGEDELPELYQRSAVQVIPQAPGTEGGSLPSKLPNLLATGVHVLGVCAPTSEVAQVLTSTQTGTLVPEWTEDAFVDGVRAALADAATTSQQLRCLRAAGFLEGCQVSSLARLVVD